MVVTVVPERRHATVAGPQLADGTAAPGELDLTTAVVDQPHETLPAAVVEHGGPYERPDHLAEQPAFEHPRLTEVRRAAAPAEALRVAVDRGVEVEVWRRLEAADAVGRE